MRITESWLQKHHESFVKATMHPFILSIKQGTINPSSFKTWLAQDYIFVREFVPFVASVLVKACRKAGDPDGRDMETILGGLASLHDEISWFKKEASKWDVPISGVAAQESNKEYCRFLENLMQPKVDYAISITAFWAIEMVYQTSFQLCLEPGSKTPAVLRETCQRWGNSSFNQYCASLQSIVDHCLEKAEDDVLRKAEEAFVRVLHNEVEFWNMSYGDALHLRSGRGSRGEEEGATMAATITSVTVPNTRLAAPKPEAQRFHALSTVNFPLRMRARRLALHVRATTPPQHNISDAVQESIKQAQATCADDPASGECVAAWDEVEELSAAASHARQKKKEVAADPLEAFCKDNPETDECRMYED